MMDQVSMQAYQELWTAWCMWTVILMGFPLITFIRFN